MFVVVSYVTYKCWNKNDKIEFIYMIVDKSPFFQWGN